MKWISFIFLFSYTLSAQTWQQLPDFPGPERDDGIAVEVNGKGYFGTGLKVGWTLGGDFYALDLSTNTWSALPSMPSGSERQYACAFKGNNCFYVVTGDGNGGPLNSLYKFDINANTWLQLGSKPGAGIQGASVFEFGNKVLLFGGRSAGNTANQEVWEYTLSSNTWTQKNNFPVAYKSRWRGSAAVLNNAGYFLYGLDATNSYRKELLRYDPANDSWTKLMDVPVVPARAYAALKALNEELLLFGGQDSLNTYYNSTWFYSPLNAQWSLGPALPSFGRKGGMALALGNKFYYSCGIDQNNQRLKETWVLDLPVDLHELSSKSAITLYPNPCKDKITLLWNDTFLKPVITVFDISGRVLNCPLLEEKLQSCTLNISELDAGLFYIKTHFNSGVETTYQLIKQ